MSTSDSTHHKDLPEGLDGTASNTPVHPFVHPLMIPQFNPLYYWPYFLNLHPMMYPFAQFPIGHQLQVVCPFHAAACYHFHQSMMNVPRCVPFGIPPSAASQSHNTQSTNTGSGTVITN